MIKWKQESGNKISQPEIPRNSRNPKALNGSGLRMRKLLDSPWQTLSIPSAFTPIGQLHQSPPSPVPGDFIKTRLIPGIQTGFRNSVSLFSDFQELLK